MEEPVKQYVITVLTQISDHRLKEEDADIEPDNAVPGLVRYASYGPFATKKEAREWADECWENIHIYGIITELREPDANIPFESIR